MKILLAIAAMLSITACAEVNIGDTSPKYTYVQGPAIVTSVVPNYAMVAVGYPYAHFENQFLGYTITYEKNGQTYTTFSKNPYFVGSIIPHH